MEIGYCPWCDKLIEAPSKCDKSFIWDDWDRPWHRTCVTEMLAEFNTDTRQLNK